MVILVSTLERGAAQPRPFFSRSSPSPPPPFPMRTRLCVFWVQLSKFALLHNGSWCSMDDNFFEYGVLFTQYMTLNFSISVLLSAWFEWMPHLINVMLSVTQYIFLLKKEVVHVTKVVYWIIRPLLLENYEAEIKRVLIFFLESSFWNAAARQKINFHMPRNSKAAPYFLNTNKFKGKNCMW